MNDRKQHVIQTAHKLFTEKGYQATSIQDIIEVSGISKGTFYNYFSSKGELVIAIFKTLQISLEKERNDLLIGRERSDINIFIKQIELQMQLNKKNKLFNLYEEVFVSNDRDLKQFIKKAQFLQLGWIYNRFIDIFGEKKRPYLLDCAIMFLGMFHHNIHYYTLAYEESTKMDQVIRYSVDRLVKMVDEVSESKQQLFEPELIEKWLPGCKNQGIKSELIQSFSTLKKLINSICSDEEEVTKYLELIGFIQDELLHTFPPRKFVIDSALFFLKSKLQPICEMDWQQFEKQMASFLEHTEKEQE